MEGDKQFPQQSESVEDAAEKTLMLEKMRSCVCLLGTEERELIDALFFSNGGEGMSERKYADTYGIPRKTVAYQRNQILLKLHKLLES
jgi:hypothetical protein